MLCSPVPPHLLVLISFLIFLSATRPVHQYSDISLTTDSLAALAPFERLAATPRHLDTTASSGPPSFAFRPSTHFACAAMGILEKIQDIELEVRHSVPARW